MTRFFSFNKLLSHPAFDKLDINDLYVWQKDYSAELHHDDYDEYVAGYTLDDRAVVMGYDIANNRLKFREYDRLPDYEAFQNINIHSHIFGKGFISPEIQILSYPDRNIGKFDFYFELLLYLMHEFKLTVTEMKSIINASLFESEDMMDVFTVPYTGNIKSRRLGVYLFINGIDNGVLIDRMRMINKDLSDNNDHLLHLTAYYGLLIPHLEYSQLESFKTDLNDLINHVDNLNRYDISEPNKSMYENLYLSFQDSLQDRETYLLRTTIQTVRYDYYKHNLKLQAQIAKGARVNVIIGCGNSDWEV